MAYDFTFKVHWAQIRRGSETFLQERVEGQSGWTEFGPVCPLLVKALVDERKAYYQLLAQSHINPREFPAGSL